MSVFDYNSFCDPKETMDDNPHKNECIYCHTKLKTVDLEDFWGETDNSQLAAIHEDTAAGYKELHNLEDCYLKLKFDTKDEEVWLNYCEVCGWWRVIKDVSICAEQWQIWDIFFGLSGTLKSLDLSDIRQPIEEISSYLVAKYQNRFSINPRIFEQVVASVFKNIGHEVHVTGYSNDGGVDVILGNTNETRIGVQVKRYKNKIKVEQIRAFAGALLLSGYKKGIFVTTSDFQPAAIKASQSYALKTLPIQLINAREFYEALKISQRTFIDIDRIKHCLKNQQALLFEYEWDTPRNSL